jgi:hypothetical protein
MGPFRILKRIRGDIQKRLFAGVNLSTTPAINEKSFEMGSFLYFVEMLLDCCLYSYSDFFTHLREFSIKFDITSRYSWARGKLIHGKT